MITRKPQPGPFPVLRIDPGHLARTERLLRLLAPGMYGQQVGSDD